MIASSSARSMRVDSSSVLDSRSCTTARGCLRDTACSALVATESNEHAGSKRISVTLESVEFPAMSQQCLASSEVARSSGVLRSVRVYSHGRLASASHSFISANARSSGSSSSKSSALEVGHPSNFASCSCWKTFVLARGVDFSS